MKRGTEIRETGRDGRGKREGRNEGGKKDKMKGRKERRKREKEGENELDFSSLTIGAVKFRSHFQFSKSRGLSGEALVVDIHHVGTLDTDGLPSA